MNRKWKPNASQRRAFAERMSNPKEQAEYHAKKDVLREKRIAKSKFDYSTAGGEYVPTKEQHDYCLFELPKEATPEQRNAAEQVMVGYSTGLKVSHDHIHIINEMRRSII